MERVARFGVDCCIFPDSHLAAVERSSFEPSDGWVVRGAALSDVISFSLRETGSFRSLSRREKST